MNRNHYPNLERCKKMTDMGFPICSKFWQYGEICDTISDCITYSESVVCPSLMEIIKEYCIIHNESVVCPSLMEIIEELREDRRRVALSSYLNQEDSPRMGKLPLSLPDWLAECWIFDKENNYLPKGK